MAGDTGFIHQFQDTLPDNRNTVDDSELGPGSIQMESMYTACSAGPVFDRL